jgi:hypothetical protein
MKGICFFVQQSAAEHKAKTRKTGANNANRTAEVYFRQGSSDKVYHLQLQNVLTPWSVSSLASISDERFSRRQ